MSAEKFTKPPRVRIARPDGRPFQVRYTEPETGKEIRLSVGSRSEADAERLKAETEARLILGVPATKRRTTGPAMSWDRFREEYRSVHLVQLRPDTGSSTENRLDVCERLADARTLGEMAQPETLSRLKARLLVGRSPHTVNSYLRTLVAALNWAHKQMGWLPTPVRKTTVEADDPDKGRPITGEEFDRLLVAVDKVCPHDPDSWRYLLRGLWESGLRIGEAMAMTWDVPGTIQPVFPSRGRPVLLIPGGRQKNRKRQEVALLDSFVALLDESTDRTGHVFRPAKRNGDKGRPTPATVERTISDVGTMAGIITNELGKTCSAHDLRRSFAQRLVNAGVGPRDLQKIMRHSCITTTEEFYLRDDASGIADRINSKLGTGPKTVPSFDPKTVFPNTDADRETAENTGKTTVSGR